MHHDAAKIAALRADTPGAERLIHLNNAGASLQPAPVLKAVHDYLTLETQLGGYEANDAAAPALTRFYEDVARLLHTRARNISFVASATDGFARALSAFPFKPGDAILTTNTDYASSQIAFLSLQERFGVTLLRARELPEGGLDLEDFEQLARQHRPVLVSLAHVPTNSGLVQPAEAVGRICRELGIWYLLDACQSAGQIDLDVEAIGCDFLATSARKFLRGPRGAGFMFVSDRVLDANLSMLLPDMRGADWTDADTYRNAPTARRFEYWETPVAMVLGTGAAAAYALDTGMEWIENRVAALADFTRRELATLPGVRVLDEGARRCGIVTAHAAHWTPGALMQKLQARQINCRISPLVAAQIDFRKKGVEWALRVSPHYYNTEDEIRQAVELLRAEFPR